MSQQDTLNPLVREFDTGATRDLDHNKLDFEAFLSFPVLKRYAQYMHINRFQKDGTVRPGDNWQKGIPKEVYMKSMYRHFMDVWASHRGYSTNEDLQTALSALLFNVMGYLHEELKYEPECTPEDTVRRSDRTCPIGCNNAETQSDIQRNAEGLD